jgi:hypothetical protein
MCGIPGDPWTPAADPEELVEELTSRALDDVPHGDIVLDGFDPTGRKTSSVP